MYEAWERYRELLHKCPLHGFPLWTQVTMFYNATNAPTRMMLDASANGTLLDKAPEEAIEILNKLAKNDFQFPTSRRGGVRRQATVNELDSSSLVAAQLASLTKMVQNLQLQHNTREVKVIDSYCDLCGGNHSSADCMNQETGMYVGNYNRNNVMSNTYNPSWKRHPNLSWSNPNNALNPITQPPGFQQPMPQQQVQ